MAKVTNLNTIDEKICGEIDCVRYDVDSPLCDVCEFNMKWKQQINFG